MSRILHHLGASLLAAAVILSTTGCGVGGEGDSEAEADAGFVALQDRGMAAMGVDQYTSTHRFDALPDGGRIELQRDVDDPEGVQVIREHLREIREAFARGDFTTPAFVHAQEVPGTAVMAARRDLIEYVYADLPRGGEVRLTTTDPAAIEAIHAFMAFQRDDHRAGGAGHELMDHGAGGHEHMQHAPGAGRSMDTSAGGGGQHLASAGGDTEFAADMAIVHELLVNHRAITRTVEHLPDGIRTLTESSSPGIAAAIVEHVARMEERLDEGSVFNISSHSLPTIFEHYDRIETEIVYGPTGVTVLQTSDDPTLVAALQAHAAEVTGMVDEGMMAMMRGMMTNGPMSGGTTAVAPDGPRRMGGMGMTMHGGMQGMMHGGAHGGQGGPGQMNEPGATSGMTAP